MPELASHHIWNLDGHAITVSHIADVARQMRKEDRIATALMVVGPLTRSAIDAAVEPIKNAEKSEVVLDGISTRWFDATFETSPWVPEATAYFVPYATWHEVKDQPERLKDAIRTCRQIINIDIRERP